MKDLCQPDGGAVLSVSDSLPDCYTTLIDEAVDGRDTTGWVSDPALSEHCITIEWLRVPARVRRVDLDFGSLDISHVQTVSYVRQREKKFRLTTVAPKNVNVRTGDSPALIPAKSGWKSRTIYQAEFQTAEDGIRRFEIRFSSPKGKAVGLRHLRVFGQLAEGAYECRPKWKGQWIWHEGEPSMPGIGVIRRYFRAGFHLSPRRKVRESVLMFVAYDRGTVFLNGKKIAQSLTPGYSMRRDVLRVAIKPEYFRTGKNLLAICGENTDSHRSRGVLAELWMRFADETQICVATNDRDFTACASDVPGWKSADQQWPPAEILPEPPNSPLPWLYTQDYTPPFPLQGIHIEKYALVPAVPVAGERFRLELSVRPGGGVRENFAAILEIGEHGATELQWMDFKLGDVVARDAVGRGKNGKVVIEGTWPAGTPGYVPLTLRFCNPENQLAILSAPAGQITKAPHPGRWKFSAGTRPNGLKPGFASVHRGDNGGWVIDGKNVPPFLFSSSLSTLPVCLDMLSAGVRLFRILSANSCNLNPPDRNEDAHYERILSVIEAHAGAFLSVAPDTRFILMARIDMSNLWKLEHPEELIAMGENRLLQPLDATDQSRGFGQETPNAPGVLARVRESITAFLRRLERKWYARSVIGLAFYHGCAGENYWGLNHNGSIDENGNFQFSEREDYLIGDVGLAARRGLRDWLRTRYPDDESFANAWKMPGLKIADVANPSKLSNTKIHRALMRAPGDDPDNVFRDPQRDGTLYEDFFEHQNEARVALFREACSTVKKVTKGGLIAGGYSGGYALPGLMNSAPGFAQHCAQAAWRSLMESPEMDFVIGLHFYHFRRPGDPALAQGLADSVRLHGKMWINEFDSRTHRAPFPPKAFNERATIHHLRKEFGSAITKEQGFWWLEFLFERKGKTAATWFSTPDVLAEIAVMKRIYDHHLTLPAVAPRAEIAVIVNVGQTYHLDPGAPASTIHSNVVNRLLAKMHITGAPFDLYALSDLDRMVETGAFDSYRVILFPNAWRLSARARKIINALKRDGRTLVFFYAPGYQGDSSPHLSLRGMETVTGLAGMGMTQARRRLGLRFKAGQPEEIFRTRAWWGPEFAWQRRGMGEEIGPIFHLKATSGAEVLAHLEVDGKVHRDKIGLAARDFRNHRIVYSALPDLPLEVLAGVFRNAGVHFYAPTGMISYANERFVCVQASEGGPVTLSSKNSKYWVNPFACGVSSAPARDITIPLSKGETRLYCLAEAGEWEAFSKTHHP